MFALHNQACGCDLVIDFCSSGTSNDFAVHS